MLLFNAVSFAKKYILLSMQNPTRHTVCVEWSTLSSNAKESKRFWSFGRVSCALFLLREGRQDVRAGREQAAWMQGARC